MDWPRSMVEADKHMVHRVVVVHTVEEARIQELRKVDNRKVVVPIGVLVEHNNQRVCISRL